MTDEPKPDAQYVQNLIERLGRVWVSLEDHETFELKLTVSREELGAILLALEHAPKAPGNPGAIRGRAKVAESTALVLLRGRVQQLVDQGMPRTQALLQVVETDGPQVFLRWTGRQLKPSTIETLMKQAPTKRRATRRSRQKSKAKSAGPNPPG